MSPHPGMANLRPGMPAGCDRDPKTGRLRSKKRPSLSREVEDELSAMKRVVATPAEDDTSYQHQRLRKWFDDDVRGFMARLGRLQDEQRSSDAASGKSAVTADLDEGSDRAAELWERLLAEHGEERE